MIRYWINGVAAFVKLVSLPFGLALIILSLLFISSAVGINPSTEKDRFIVFYSLFVISSLLAGGITLVYSITRTLKVHVPSGGFFRFPKFNWLPSYGYGFPAALGLGLGATLGSPLFVLIPVNVLQYGVISILSLVAGAGISLLLAHLYARMYKEWNEKGRDCTDGPSFTKNACGRNSLRYFIARFGLWIANTAFAAYSLIISATYASLGFSQTIQPIFNPPEIQVIVMILFVAPVLVWFVVNAFFEKRYARTIGAVQLVMTVILVLIVLLQSGMLASIGNRPFTSPLTLSFGDLSLLFIGVTTNTALLFLHFFGFQEVQALSSDLASKSSIPGLGFVKRFRDMDRVRFAKYAMIGSVIIASIVNLFYAIAVYRASPSLPDVESASIPAVYISQSLLGPWSALFMGVAFIIASITTFVPAFLASSRHLRALSKDGFFPKGLEKSAWVFSLIAIVILSWSNGDFLVKIIDFSVLVALAIVSLSAVWSRKLPFWRHGRGDLVPILVGFACLVSAGALYLVDANVVLFGILFIMVGYLLFDIFELGSYGSLLFLAVLYLVQLGLTEVLISSGVLADSPTLAVSIYVIQSILHAAVVVFAINIALSARHRIMSFFDKAWAKTGSSVSRFRKAQKARELDKVIDSWVRLMESRDKIETGDPTQFEKVKRLLEQRLRALGPAEDQK